MACLEELIADVARIRGLLETKKDCCDDNVTYFPTEEPSTEIMPGVGDPPDYYGETAVTDWDDWLEHVCYNAHAYVDYLKDTSWELMTAVNVSSIFLGLISSALVLLAFSGIGLPIAFGLAAAVVTGIALGATATTFQNTASDFETARQDIVCAILNGASLAGAVEDALSSGTDWDLFYQFVDYDAAIAILYEGGYNEDYLPSETRDDCVCYVDTQFLFEWDTDLDGWASANLTMLWDANEYVTCTPSGTVQWRYTYFWYWVNLGTRFSLDLPIDFDQVRFKFLNHSDSGSAVRQQFKFTVYGDGASAESQIWDTDDFNDDEWHQIIWNLPEIITSKIDHNWSFRMDMYRFGQVTTLRRMWLDDFGFFLK